MTTTATHIVEYIKSQIHPWGEMQLQKLVYYSQAWALVWEGRPLFDERIEAWTRGPVTPSLRHRCGPLTVADPLAISFVDRRIVDSVLEFYGQMTGGELSARTHIEGPWLAARGDTPANQPSDEEISRQAMLRFHTRQALTGDGPKPASRFADARDDDVDEAAREGEMLYAGALELLAQ